MGVPIRLALVPEQVTISPSDLTQVSAALSKQVDQDFCPLWNVEATIDAFAQIEDVPSDYWQITIVAAVNDAAGYHEDRSGQPFALVQFGEQWSLTASHECLEMLADPFGRRVQGGNVPDQALSLGVALARVNYLVEACDPCESAAAAYQVNGVLVSDFITPHYYDSEASAGTRYSFTGAIAAPRQILPDGYISWQDQETQHWMQLRMFADNVSNSIPHIVDVTSETRFDRARELGNVRAAMDRVTKAPPNGAGLVGMKLERTQARANASLTAREARARIRREDIARLMGK